MAQNKNDKLDPIITKYIEAVNAHDTNAVLATFADDAFVNDVHRELQGVVAIKKWVEKEIVGVKVSIDVRETIEHYVLPLLEAPMTVNTIRLIYRPATLF